jgi:ectoine hydroxylase-related dioxygenase (phytanoyl-CoA dioxygenase family)
MAPHNGSTEVWLGTHAGTGGIEAQEGAHGERASGRIKEDIKARWVATHGPPIQPNIKKGSIVIRDLRLWHAGMPNMSDEVRVMLAMIHFASWYRNPMRLEFAEDVKPVFEELESRDELGLEVAIDWVTRQRVMDGYLNRAFGNAYDFDQAP